MKKEKNKEVIVENVNNFFNDFTYISDQELYGKSDYWASPKEFVLNGGGDCKSYIRFIAGIEIYKKISSPCSVNL
jgi:predicted transglutaminase-like cysteine proteinase